MSQHRRHPHHSQPPPSPSPSVAPAPAASAAPPEPSRAAKPAGSGCLVRLVWIFLGNILLAVSAVNILLHRGSFLSGWDALFWGTVALLIPIRYLDVVRFRGETAAGHPATLAHWRRYAILLPLVAAAAWAAGHAWAYFLR